MSVLLWALLSFGWFLASYGTTFKQGFSFWNDIVPKWLMGALMLLLGSGLLKVPN